MTTSLPENPSELARAAGALAPADGAALLRLLHELAGLARYGGTLADTLQGAVDLLTARLQAGQGTALQVVWINDNQIDFISCGEPFQRTRSLVGDGARGDATLGQLLIVRPVSDETCDVFLPLLNGARTVALLEWQQIPCGADASLLTTLFEAVQLHLNLWIERNALRVAAADDPESQRRFLLDLVENLPVSLFVYSADELRVLSVNQHAEREFSVQREAILGKTVEEAFGPAVGAMGRPVMKRAMGRTAPTEHEFTGSITGTPRVVSVRHVALRDADGTPRFLVALLRDLTEQRAAERALQESESRLREFTESMQDVLFVTDPDRSKFHFLSANNQGGAWQEQRKSLMSNSMLFLNTIPKEDRPQLEERRAAEYRLETTDVSYRVLHPKLGERWMRTRTRSRRGPEGDVRVYGIISDITAERQQQIDLQKARDAAESASQAKSQFMANMSHEIRTPMNGILGMTELLLATVLSDKQRRFVQAVYRSGESLLEIINDILDFSKVEAGRLGLCHVDHSLRSVVEDTMEMLSPRAHEKGLELVFRETPGLPPAVNGDPMRLRQVLTNLVANAIKFTEQGEVEVSIEPLAAPGGRPGAVITVRDTGIGIEPDVLPYVFDAFMQASAGMSRRYGGTGLGLTIARQLIGLMGGSISVDSRIGVGSEFRIELALQPPVAEPDLREAGELPTMRVLVVDDHAGSRTVLAELLAGWGIETTVANDGRAALELLRAEAGGACPFNVALVDMHMPNLDGMGLARVLQSTGLHPDLKLILLSSMSTPDDMQAAHDAGFGRVVAKPVRKSELRQALLGISASPTESPRLTPALNAHILVVEDNVVNQEVIGQMLRSLGCRVQVSSGGLAGLRALCDKHFDLVLMDIQMPGMDGVEVLNRFRQPKTGRYSFLTPTDTPVIAVTANALESDEKRFLGLGFDGYLSKPFRQSQLLAMLTQHLQLSAPADTGQSGAGGSGAASTPSSGAAGGLDVLDAGALDRLRELDPHNENRLMERVVSAFETSVARLMPQLQDALEASELAGIRHVSHTLKSSSASIGAVKLSKMCSEIEAMARQNQSDGMTERVVLLQAEVEIVRVALQRMLNA